MEAKEIDRSGEEIMQYLLYLYLEGAQALSEFVKKFQEFLLDENLTMEQAEIVKKELGFSNRTLRRIKSASMYYKAMMRELEAIDEELQRGLDASAYDHRQDDYRELIAHNILYIYRTHGNDKQELEIRRFMKYMEGGKPDATVTNLIRHFQKNF